MAEKPVILCLTVDSELMNQLHKHLSDWGLEVLGFRHPGDAKPMLTRWQPALLLADLNLPEVDGLSFLDQARQSCPGALRVLMGNSLSERDIVRAINEVKVYAYLPQPLDIDELKIVLRMAMSDLRKQQEAEQHVATLEERVAKISQQNKELAMQQIELIRSVQKRVERYPHLIGGQAPTMQTFFQQVDAISKIDGPVLIIGEAGTGKELAARAVHQNSLRQQQPFLSLDGAAVPEPVLSAQLFGTAGQLEKTQLEMAHRGTLLIKNVDQVSANIQEKLSNFLKTGRFYKNDFPVEVNIRLIATTRQTLRPLVERGVFAADLQTQLAIIAITVPPLRQRIQDIPLLVQHFVSYYARQYHKTISEVESSLVRHLQTLDWSGNIRELENLIQRLIIFAQTGTLKYIDLPAEYRLLSAGASTPQTPTDSMASLDELERNHIQQVLAACRGNKSKAARVLGLKRTTLLFRMQKLGLN